VAYYQNKADGRELKAIETKIANVRKELDETTKAYIKAVATENEVLEQGCQTQSKELKILLDDLEKERIKQELSKGLEVTKVQVKQFMKEFIHGEIDDKEFQKMLIDHIVRSVYVYDDTTIVYFNVGIKNSNKVTKADSDIQHEHFIKTTPNSSGFNTFALPKRAAFEPSQ
jgi:hypothetical protein